MALKVVSERITRRPTRAVFVRDLQIGAGAPISVQSMCATRTQDLVATLRQIKLLEEHGADIIRIAIDSKKDVEALIEIRKQTKARLVVDLQENYRLAVQVAPYVDKIRYNPGHLHHHEKDVPVFEKVRLLVDTARQYSLALRIGVNFGSLDPAIAEGLTPGAADESGVVALEGGDSRFETAIRSASEHIGYMQELGFENFVVSLKSSNPNDVIDINRQFSDKFPLVPLHLGVTEAGMLPMGEIKTRIAFESLMALGIGDTVRVSLTLPYEDKYQEIEVGKAIVQDVYAGRFRSVPRFEHAGLNIISCPSCSRVENEAFVHLAQEVREMSKFAEKEQITIAVMGCRVNGPGETDEADLGLWCAPNHVNLKRKSELIGAFPYDEILPKLREELELLIVKKGVAVVSH